jgi:hypothetical protein
MSKKISKGKQWSIAAIMLGVTLILAGWLPADSWAGARGHAFGNKAMTGNAGVNQIPQEPIKVLNPGDPYKILIPSDPIKGRNPGNPVSPYGGSQ